MRRLWLVVPWLCLVLQVPTIVAAQEPPAVPSPNAPVAVTTSTERPLNHEELLSVRGELRDRSYRPTTLVADAIIVRDRLVRNIEEPDPSRRGIGVLPRDDRYPGEPVVQANRRVRALHPDDRSSIQGRLAFDVDIEGIQLLGTVATPVGSYVTPIDPAALAMADTLPAGTLIVAHGRLSSLGSRATCPALPQALDPHDTGGWSDPFVRCPGGWLTSERVSETDSSDPLAPAAPGIPVQWGASERFAGDMDVERSATYLLRHVANPVAGAEPSFGWEVIGRLDPLQPPEPETAMAAPLAEADRPGGLEWRPVVERQPPADTLSIHSTAWKGGFASVHVGHDRVLSSWVSADGEAWQHASLPAGITWVRALLPLREGLAIIADEAPFGPAWRFEVWTSKDGLHWREASRQRIPVPERFTGYRRLVHGYWPTKDGIAALQTYTQQPCCGSAPRSTLLVAAKTQQPDVTYVWTSRDGRRWQQQRAKGVHGDPGQHLGSSISAAGGELLALWPDRSQMIGRSTDGVLWRTIGRYPADLDTYSSFVLARADGGLVLAGEPFDSDIGTGSTLTVWRQDGQGEWVRTLPPRQGSAESIVSIGRTVIVSGGRLDPERLDDDDIPRLAWLLVSSDGGRTWDESLSWFGDSPWCLQGLTEGETGVLLDVACPSPEAASKYLVDAEE